MGASIAVVATHSAAWPHAAATAGIAAVSCSPAAARRTARTAIAGRLAATVAITAGWSSGGGSDGRCGGESGTQLQVLLVRKSLLLVVCVEARPVVRIALLLQRGGGCWGGGSGGGPAGCHDYTAGHAPCSLTALLLLLQGRSLPHQAKVTTTAGFKSGQHWPSLEGRAQR